MKKILFPILLMGLCLSQAAEGQTHSSPVNDSLLNDLINAPKNSFVISLGIGNNPYNLEAKTGGQVSQQAFLLPGLAYFHKTGLGIGTHAYGILGDTYGGKRFFEYDISPFYDYDKGKAFSFGISFSKYFYSDSASLPQSPLTNEGYGYVNYNNWWLVPVMGFDYAFGHYKDNTGADVSASDLLLILSVKHYFSFDGILNTDDYLSLTPLIALTAGTDKYLRSFGSTSYGVRNNKHELLRSTLISRGSFRTSGRGRSIGSGRTAGRGSTSPSGSTYTYGYTSEESQFLPRTLEAAFTIGYGIGKFSLEPSYFLDIPLQPSEKSAYGYFLATLSFSF